MKRLLALRCLFSVRTSKERERSLYLNRCPSLVKTPRVLIGRRMCLHASRCRSGSVYFLLIYLTLIIPCRANQCSRDELVSPAVLWEPSPVLNRSPVHVSAHLRAGETNKRIQKSTPWNTKYIRQQAWQFRWQSSLVIMTKLCGKSTEWGKAEWLMRKEAVRCIIESLGCYAALLSSNPTPDKSQSILAFTVGGQVKGRISGWSGLTWRSCRGPCLVTWSF